MTNSQIGAVLAAATAAYYLVAWLIVGRRRSRRSVIVRYSPPQGLSPAAMRFIYTTRVDGRTWAATIAQLAAHGFIEIVPQERGIILKKLIADHRALNDLTVEEGAVLKSLFEWAEQVPMKPPEWRDLEKLQETLEAQSGEKFFTRNLPWVIAGLAATAVATVWLGLSSGLFGNDSVEAWVGSIFAGLTVAIYGAFGYHTWDRNVLAVKLALRGIYGRRTLLLLAAFILIYPTLWYVLIRTVAPGFAIATELMILVNTFLPSCLRSYTAEGRSVREEIEGFRQFLSGTEQDRLQRMNQPGAPAQAAREFIAYAIALDVRENWGDTLAMKAMVETEL